MFVYSVRVMAVLFHLVSFKWTVVDMFDHGVEWFLFPFYYRFSKFSMIGRREGSMTVL